MKKITIMILLALSFSSFASCLDQLRFGEWDQSNEFLIGADIATGFIGTPTALLGAPVLVAAVGTVLVGTHVTILIHNKRVSNFSNFIKKAYNYKYQNLTDKKFLRIVKKILRKSKRDDLTIDDVVDAIIEADQNGHLCDKSKRKFINGVVVNI